VALAIDGSTPAVATNTSTTVATITTASFTPPAGALLLVMWAGDTQASVTPGTPTITDNLGAHLTYTLVDHRKLTDTPTGVDGQAAVWWAVVGSSAAMTVTVTSGTASGARESALKVVVITGQHATPIGAHGTSGTKSAASIAQSYTGTASSNWGFIAICDWDLKGAETAGTGCTVINSANVASAISYGFLRRTTADGTNGGSTTLNVTIPTTSTNLCWCYVEVVPAATAAATFPPSPRAGRRRSAPPARVRRGGQTIPPQQVPAVPALTQRTVGRRAALRALAARSRTFGDTTPPVDARLFPFRTMGRRWLRPRLGRVRGDLTPPTEQPPPPPTLRRRPRLRRPGFTAGPTPVQAAPTPPDFRPQPPGRRRPWLQPPRPAIETPVPQPATVVAPTRSFTPLRTRRAGLRRRAGAVVSPVPTQQAVVPPTYPPSIAKARRFWALPRRAEAVTPVPAQVTITPPAYPPSVAKVRRVLGAFTRRGHTPTPTLAPTVPLTTWTPAAPHPRRPAAPTRRPRTQAPPGVQAGPSQPVRQKPRRITPRRARAATPVPPQVAVVASPRPPGVVRGLRRFASAARRTRPGVWLFGGVGITTSRGRANVTGRAGSSTGTTFRTGSTAAGAARGRAESDITGRSAAAGANTDRDGSTAHIEEVP
jgi:hypothetical protein